MTRLFSVFLLLLLARSSFPKLQLFHIEDPLVPKEKDIFHVTGSLSHAPFGGLFGYSLAVFRESGQVGLLVGAPKQADRGNVHVCSFSADGARFSCRNLSLELPPDSARAPQDLPGFLGSSVAATTLKDRAFLLFCDHLFAFREKGKEGQRPRASGLCNLRKASGSAVRPWHPCASADCLSGLASALRPSESAGELLAAVGMPNIEQGHGRAAVSVTPPGLNNSLSFSFSHVTPHDGGYLTGFAVALGQAEGVEGLFVSNAGASSKVEAFKRVATDKKRLWQRVAELPQPQVEGAIPGHFGFALASVNFAPQADPPTSSLLASDPFFSLPKANMTDAGAVFIFCRLQSRPSAVLVGPQTDGQFGAALAVVGDVTNDRIPDFAVGCPYCDGGQGSVFVFRGRTDCAAEAPISVIRGIGLRGFGWSLSGAEDFDGNGSPDLAIGAALTGAVVVARSRPVVTATCSKQGKCRLSEQGKGTCAVTFEFTLDFGRYTPLRDFQLTIQVDFDSRKPAGAKRMQAVVPKQPPLQNAQTKNVIRVRVSPKLNEKLFQADPTTPIEWEARIALGNASAFALNASGHPLPPPVLRTSLCSFAPVIQNVRCGTGDCTTDLQVHLAAPPAPVVYPQPSTKVSLRLEVGLKEAIRASVRLSFRNGARFGTASTDCTVIEDEAEAVCSFGAFMEQALAFDLFPDLSAVWKRGWDPLRPPEVLIEARSTNPDANTSNNRLRVNFTADYRPNVTLAPHSDSDLTVMDNREQIAAIPGPNAFLRNIGPRLHHVYLLSNLGPSPALGLEVTLELPLWAGPEPLLYLLAEVRSERGPVTTAPRILSETGSVEGRCQVPEGHLNPRALIVRDDYEAIERDFSDRANRSRRRRRRSVAAEPGRFSCPQTGCVRVLCRLNRLAPGAVARVVFDAWLWGPTVAERQLTDVRVTSKAWGRVGAAPERLQLTRNFTFGPVSTTTSFVFSKVKVEEPSRFPMVALGIVIGIVLLVLLVFILYKCHFFERKNSHTITAKRVSHLELSE